jgi:hypothetical protein
MGKNIYSIIYDFSSKFKHLKVVKLKQVEYRYNEIRTYQSIIIEGDYIFDAKNLCDNIKKDSGIMSMIHFAGGISLYGFFNHNIAITLKKDIQLSEARAFRLIKYILKRYNSKYIDFSETIDEFAIRESKTV